MNKNEKFQEVLDESYQWPAEYMFKFIIPLAQMELAKKILSGFKISEKVSSKGSYVSLSAKKVVKSSAEVILIYQKMAIVEGVVSL